MPSIYLYIGSVLSFFAAMGFGAQLPAGGQTIAGPGLFIGAAGDSGDVYQAQAMGGVCITLSAVIGNSRILTDGTVPALAAPKGATISGCGEASLVTISCDTKCKAEWRIDGVGNVVIENIDIPPAQVHVVGILGPPGPPGPPGPDGPAGSFESVSELSGLNCSRNGELLGLTVSVDSSSGVVTLVCDAPLEVCNDGVDNDNNGFTDCDDFACSSDPACVGAPLF